MEAGGGRITIEDTGDQSYGNMNTDVVALTYREKLTKTSKQTSLLTVTLQLQICLVNHSVLVQS